MSDESNAEVKLTPGQKIAGQIVNVLDTQHPEINWPYDTIAALIDQGIDAEQEPHPAARLKLGIANADNPSDQIILEIKGSNDWVKETSVCLHGLLDSLNADAPFEIVNLEEAHQELRDAFAAAEKGESFTGSIIRTKLTLTGQAADSEVAAT